MEAGNLGASEAGGCSIGLNIVLPHEQVPNEYVTPELCFNFHYFGIRKMHFLLRAKAIAVFPGGFGTLDELFESLTLIQTGRMEQVPVLLFGEKFWRDVVNWDALAEAGTIAGRPRPVPLRRNGGGCACRDRRLDAQRQARGDTWKVGGRQAVPAQSGIDVFHEARRPG
jgi:hypothetical protein